MVDNIARAVSNYNNSCIKYAFIDIPKDLDSFEKEAEWLNNLGRDGWILAEPYMVSARAKALFIKVVSQDVTSYVEYTKPVPPLTIVPFTEQF